MLNFKDKYVTIAQEKENECSLPHIIQLIQPLYGFTPSYTGAAPGVFGAGNMAYTIELPNIAAQRVKLTKDPYPLVICPNFANIEATIKNYRILKFSRASLFNKFYIYKINDYGQQGYTPGFLDFVPFVFNSDGHKIPQCHIGILRSYTSKNAYILIDKSATYYKSSTESKPIYLEENTKAIKENMKTIKILYKFKRYHDVSPALTSKNNTLKKFNNANNIGTLKYDKETDKFTGTIVTNLAALAQEDYKYLSFYYDGYKLENNHVMQNLVIDRGSDRAVERQSSRSGNIFQDYYKNIMAMRYNVDAFKEENSAGVLVSDLQPFEIPISMDNIVESNTQNDTIYVCLEEYNPVIIQFEATDDIDKKCRENYNLTDVYKYYKITCDFNDTGSLSSYHEIGKITKNRGIVEVVPLNYEDRTFIIKITSNGNLNVHQSLKDGNIYKYAIDLSEANIFCIRDGKYIQPTISNGTLQNLFANDIIIITIDKNIPIITEDTTDSTATIAEIDDSALHTNERYKYTIKEDPYLESYAEDSKLSNMDRWVSDNFTADQNREIFAYDAVTFDGLNEVLNNSEIRVFEVGLGKDDKNNEIKKYILSGYNQVDTSDDSFIKKYTNNASTVSKSISDIYINTIKPAHKMHTDKINDHLDTIRKNLAYIYLNIDNPKTQKVNENLYKDGFFFLAIELDKGDKDKKFDIEIEFEDVTYTEYNCRCTKINNTYIYIHLPFYFFENKNSIVENPNKKVKSIKVKNINEANKIESFKYYFQK